jgi:cullin-5
MQNVSKFDWQDLFSTNNRIASWVENGCEQLLNELKSELENHVQEAATVHHYRVSKLKCQQYFLQHIHSHSDEESLLKAYIHEWESYSLLCRYLPLPFNFIERNRPQGTPTRQRAEIQRVRNAMLKCWNRYVFSEISTRLLNAAMRFSFVMFTFLCLLFFFE